MLPSIVREVLGKSRKWLGLSIVVRIRARDREWIFRSFFFPLP